MRPFSKHSDLFNNLWAQKAGLLNYIRQEMLAGDKHSSLLGSIVSYGENKVF
jgi:hypothetical protein